MAVYRRPGVYAEEIQRYTAPSPIPATNVVALISEVEPYARFREPADLSGLNAFTLSKKGINGESVRIFSRDESTEYVSGEDFTTTQDGLNPYTSNTEISRIGGNSATETFTLDSGNNSYELLNSRGAHDIEVSTVTPEMTYQQYTDYVYDRYTGTIRALPTGTIPRDGTEITVSYNHGIEDGETVWVRYEYADENYYSRKIYGSYEDLVADYGKPWKNEDNYNALTLAAQMIFANGGPETEVMVTPVSPRMSDIEKTDVNLADWQMTIDDINEREVSLMVETSGTVEVQSYLIQNALDSGYVNRYRMAILGRDGVKDGSGRDELRAYASAVNDERVAIVHAPVWEVLNNVSGGVKRVGGQFAAAAFAGMLTKYRVQESMTRKGLAGLRTPEPERDQQLDRDTEAGLLVFENNQGFMTVRHATSTMFSDINKREINVVRAKDFMIQSMREALDKRVIGRLMEPNIDILVTNACVAVLERMTEAFVIAEYGTPQVYQNGSDPTRLDVYFEYRPNYAVNTVVIQFAIDNFGTTGAVEV